MKVILALLATLLLSACENQVNDEIVSIASNQTAFLVMFEGNNDKNQAKFDSAAAVEKHKIAAKLVRIPHKAVDVCNNCWFGHQWMDVPSGKLFVVDRAMVSREWTRQKDKGTSASDESICVESSESIDFCLGAVASAQIEESDAALYFYNYGEMPLSEVMDHDLRNYVSERLSAQFGSHNLEYDQLHKIDFFTQAKKDAAKFFKDKGITLTTFGSTEGMIYSDPAVQKSINAKFAAEMSNQAATAQASAASKLVANREAVIMQQNYELRKMELENQRILAQSWDGAAPSTIAGTGMFGFLNSLNQK